MRLLLDAGADIEARNVWGETQLITFSRHLEFVSSPESGPVTPRMEVLQLLLDSGCDVNASDGKGMTALHHLPHRRSHMATIRAAANLLIERGIDRAALDHDGREASELFRELCGMTLEDLLQDGSDALAV
jgi:ankyrin repeat protein